jgi:hypothetical protein
MEVFGDAVDMPVAEVLATWLKDRPSHALVVGAQVLLVEGAANGVPIHIPQQCLNLPKVHIGHTAKSLAYVPKNLQDFFAKISVAAHHQS